METSIFRKFTFEQWKKWINERCHGLDSVTDLVTTRDPNPHYAVIEAFKSILKEEQVDIYIRALAELIYDLLENNKKLNSKKEWNKFEEETIALERALAILSQTQVEKKILQINKITKDCFEYYSNIKPEFFIGKLLRTLLNVLDTLGEKFTDRDFTKIISSNDTYVIGFQLAEKQIGSRAISKFFSIFALKSIELKNPIAIKLELSRLQKKYSEDNSRKNILIAELRKGLKGTSKDLNHKIQIIAEEVGIVFDGTKPILSIIEERKGEIIIHNAHLVKSDTYKLLTEELVQKIDKKVAKKKYVLPKETISWGEVGPYLLSNFFDFSMDPFFKTEARGKDINVIQYGWVEGFTAIAPGHNMDISRTKLWEPSLSVSERLKGFLDRFGHHTGYLIGILGETAAAMEVVNALRDSSAFSSKIYSRVEPLDLRYWMYENPSIPRIIICDTGLAKDIVECTFEELNKKHPNIDKVRFRENKLISGADYQELNFSFERKIPVGFIYPTDDIEWRSIIIGCLRDVISENIEIIDWDNFQNELKQIGITVFSEQEFFINQLSLDNSKEFIKKFIKRLEEKQAFEKAAEFNKLLNSK